MFYFYTPEIHVKCGKCCFSYIGNICIFYINVFSYTLNVNFSINYLFLIPKIHVDFSVSYIYFKYL